ncbi:E3 ubiquitin-protein ligase DTX3L-like isoform X2 [Aquarana catesbeiana]|uniref:E3 ubiquitin-protein ligase DTX3L-like isoform X2 n=1 Tax=Aquarana catesbeiana TaxID=8400 RepID=UPI003CC9C9A6
MGDKTNQYPLLVQWDQGPEKLKELKKKLLKYFQSQKQSNGGECDIPDTDCSQGYITIYFKDKEAPQRVVQKNPHEVVLEKTTLSLWVSLPDAENSQRMGNSLFSSAVSSEDKASGYSGDTDHQQENNQNPDNRKRSNSSMTDTDSGNGDAKRHGDDFTGQGESEINRRDVVAVEGGEQNIDPSAPRSLTVNNEYMGPEDSVIPRNESRKNSLRRHMSTEEPVENIPAAPPQIFRSVRAKLDKKWFTEALQEKIKADIPYLTIKDASDFVELTGTFDNLDLVHRYVLGQLEPQLGVEKPPDTSSDWSPTDSQTDQVCFPSALYEYIIEIYRTEIDQLEEKYRVRIDHRAIPEGSTYVRFIPQGSESSPEKAKEKFTDKVQKVMDDWTQVIVDPSVVTLTFSDIKERVADRWSKIQVIKEKNMGIILRGPKDELPQVKTFLEKADHKPADHKPADHKPARPPRAVTISTSNMRTEIEVDVRHMDILKKLKLREISDIEKKYNVKMEENMKKGSLCITFRTMNAPPDLSPHASHSFITLLQKTFFNIKRKEISVRPEIKKEDANMLQEQLMMAGIDIVMEYSKDTVLLIGHPVHVAFAEEKLNGNQNPGRGQTGATSGEPMDTDSSSAATQKAEEPDKCPICLSEIEDKVILEKCKHVYCKDCLTQAMAHKPVCPICGVSYGTVRGNQPDGTMTVTTNRNSLPGYPGCGAIEIHYDIPSGIQKENHPHPGRHFSGARRTAYLPDNREGKEILSLLSKAFDQRLIFTVGDSRTTGASDTVTWNDVHHKTNIYGGAQSFGYPDPDYLTRVRDELKAKGVE